ncbi:MAG: hypothetical protein U0793_21050 [Gemmataceae bacterium]
MSLPAAGTGILCRGAAPSPQRLLEGVQQLGGGLEAIARVLGHETLHDLDQGGRRLHPQLVNRGGGLPALLIELGDETAAGKRHLAGQQIVKVQPRL